MAFEVDLTGVTDLDAVDNGGKVPVGWYRATLDEYYEDTKNEGRHVFEITVSDGAFDGKHLYFSFFDGSGAQDEKGRKMAADRIAALASRLNLLTPGQVNSVEFTAAAGKEIVINVVENKKSGFTEIAYLGIFPPDHHSIPETERKRLNLPPAKPKEATTTAAPTNAAPAMAGAGAGKVDDFSDL